MRGYWGIGIYLPKTETNVGTLWRSAYVFGASFVFTIGRRYKSQASDTVKTERHIPLYNYVSFEEFYKYIPYGCQLICVELSKHSVPLPAFSHPNQAIYLLGAEDNGLPEKILQGRQVVSIPMVRAICLNVAVAGSLIMYDRLAKQAVRGLIRSVSRLMI